MEEIAKTWIVRHFTTLEAMRKVLNNPNLELVFFGGNDSSTVPEDAVLQMVMKKEGNMLTFTEPQFKSIMESLVRAALSHAEMTKHISLQIVEVAKIFAPYTPHLLNSHPIDLNYAINLPAPSGLCPRPLG